ILLRRNMTGLSNRPDHTTFTPPLTDASRLRKTLTLFQEGKADFTDYLILTQAQSQGTTLETFDKKLRQSMES
ncbi:MAG: hypothetical protein ACSHYA_00005, partial [Opitutaceae bacterium]